jgi:hypothetical protein
MKWAKLGKGMQYGALTYNVFALSVLLFVGQLEQIPDHVLHTERAQVTKMFPGPGHWLEPEDAWYLKESYGAPKSAQPLSVLASASKLRVACLGCHFGRKHIQPRHLHRLGVDNIFARVHELHKCMRQTDHIDRLAAYRLWYEGNYCLNLVRNVHALQQIGVHADDIYRGITRKHPNDLSHEDLGHIYTSFQREVVRAIKKKQAPDVCQRIRHKLERWRDIPYGITGAPGIYSRIIHRRMHALAKIVPPRIHSAVLHTLFNGWVTHRRLQRRKWPTNRCVFRCSLEAAEDSLEHYCRCEVVQKVAKHTFHMSYPADQALNLWSLNSNYVDTEHNMLSVTLLIYGTYNAFNTLRHNPVGDSVQAFHCIVQHCKQGAFGHKICMSHLDSRWKQAMSHIC